MRGFTLPYQLACGATVSVCVVSDCVVSMQAIALAACCARLSPTKKSVALRAIVR